jgi:hypothetical protein
MSDAEAKLAAFWRENRPKPSDATFRLAVLERRARRRFYFYTGWVAAGGALAAGGVAAMSPALSSWTVSQPASGTMPLLSVVITGACMLLAFARTRQTF